MTLHEKLENLKNNLLSMERLAVAFSGGVDSTFLLQAASGVLKERAIAIIVRSSVFPEREYSEATAFAEQLKIKLITIDFDELKVAGFSDNPADRCYLCKKALFSLIKTAAMENGIPSVADGSNLDDTGDYRPGMAALKELGIVSPLKDAGLTKADIRALSREMHLSVWDKPSFACLATRFPYGQTITKEKLAAVGRAEQFLMDQGFRQVRVRIHGDVARIEVPAEDRVRILEENLAEKTYKAFRELGFQYAALDLLGYRTGSMNEPLPEVRR